MVIHNDYDEDLWNGDSGVAWRDARGEMHVSFRRGPSFRTRPLAAVAHLIERSHAVTVHKAQGSEHDEVLLVLPPVDTPLSSREIVYTAITRARRSAIVVGRSELLAGALARSSARQTGLVEALAQLDAGGSREREGTHQPAGAA
jgi:exodeoxyribonuclease V alpha subunit